jgi:energy-coupling factor transport system ATP-binding protein
MRALEGINLSFRYPNGPILFKQLDIHVEEGECVALTGPSGCGKSTLCHILSGIIPRSIEGEAEGEVLLFGQHMQNLTLRQTVQQVGVVFQNPDSQLFSPTVEDEVAFGPENLCLPREEIGKRIERALNAVKMSAYRMAGPQDLSDGQKQLIAIAAVLSLEPRALIFDEALSHLDSQYTLMAKEIIRTQKELGRAILMVEHDPENLDVADRVCRLENGRLREVRL